MKRIVKQQERVIELFLNIREKKVRAVEYGRWYVAVGSISLSSTELEALLNESDHDINPIIQQIYGRFIHRRNPYFSSKTGKHLSKWFTI